MNNRRRNFRSRPSKNHFRRRNSVASSNSPNNYNNGNKSFGRNGSSNNIHSVEKTLHKFQQLAKDAQSSGDPVLVENYLQHADHYLRRFNELSDKNKDLLNNKSEDTEKSLLKDSNDPDIQHTSN
tara:strand:+ start:765 stop:1139 length:375 start_codon:yes stop_codon:yes gene_type:complete